MAKQPHVPYRFIGSLAALSLLGMGLLAIRVFESSSNRYLFLYWNLLLAAIPLLLSWWLVLRIRRHGWLKWQQVFLSIVWLSFLPNSFYIVTDFIHLRQNFEASLLYDVVLLTVFVICGLVFGLISIYLLHKEMLKRASSRTAWGIIGGLMLASSFAIYLGRYTRWNTWDILLAPAGLLFDVSDRFINPAAHGETYQTTLIFFALLMSLYWVMWEAIRLIKGSITP